MASYGEACMLVGEVREETAVLKYRIAETAQ